MKCDRSFNEGDLVRQKAGGPTMLVEALVGDLFLCAWVDPQGRTRRATFSERELCVPQRVAPVWLEVLQRLPQRWPVVAATY